MFSWAERRSDNFQDQWEREEKGYFQDQCQMVMICSKEKYWDLTVSFSLKRSKTEQSRFRPLSINHIDENNETTKFTIH